MRQKRRQRARAAAAEADDAGDGEDGSDGEGREVLVGDRLKSVIESLLFVADEPLSAHRIRAITRASSNREVQGAIDELIEEYQDRGVLIYHVGGGYQLRSQARNASWVQKLVVGKPVRLSRAQLETLAIIAYRQPITRPEIDDIRGVDSAGTLRLLLERDLIRILGKKEEVGRPLLYGTTPDFLEFFNLNDLRDLPTLTEYSELTEESLEEIERLAPESDEEAGDEVEAAPAADAEGADETEAAVAAPESPPPIDGDDVAEADETSSSSVA
jgi:segregation and condensation protein B